MPQVLSSHAAISRKLPAKIVSLGKKAKCFDDSALITEIREKHRMPDMDQATLWLYVDNQERQRGNTNQMMHSIPELVSEISKYWRLDGRRPDLHRNSERKAARLISDRVLRAV